MRYKKFKVDPIHEDFVKCVFIWEGHASKEMIIESPPNAYGSMVFNYGDPYYISNCKYERMVVPNAFIMGQAIRNYTLHISGKVGMVGIVFKPSGLFNYFGIPMYELTEERVDLRGISPELDDLYDKISKLDKTEQKIKNLKGFLSDLSKNDAHSLSQIVNASNRILESKGIINVNDLLEDVFMSRRCFERHFLEHVGVSPKAYAKLRRYGYTCSMLAGKRKVNLTEVLFKCGYYDQSHFIKDFRYFAGRTPKFYVENNQELAHLIQEHELVRT